MKTIKQWNALTSENAKLKAQLTDANETIRQNRLTMERLQTQHNTLIMAMNSQYGKPYIKSEDRSIIKIYDDFREIALNLSRALCLPIEFKQS